MHFNLVVAFHDRDICSFFFNFGERMLSNDTPLERLSIRKRCSTYIIIALHFSVVRSKTLRKCVCTGNAGTVQRNPVVSPSQPTNKYYINTFLGATHVACRVLRVVSTHLSIRLLLQSKSRVRTSYDPRNAVMRLSHETTSGSYEAQATLDKFLI